MQLVLLRFTLNGLNLALNVRTHKRLNGSKLA